MSALFAERGGEGERLLVLLHGLGATASVWHPLENILARAWNGRWLAPDFRGHGRSIKNGPYTFEQHARDIVELLAGEAGENVTVLGHSFGGVVAALVGNGEFGIAPRCALGFGVKIRWTDEERAKALDLAKRPAKVFTSREEAIERYLKMAGLFGLVEPASPDVEAGIAASGGGWKIAQEPGTFSAVERSVPDVLRCARLPIRLAAGTKDPMVTLEDMQAIDPEASILADAGHNVHVEAPEKIWSWAQRFLK